MKKNLLKAGILMMMLALIFSFAGCSKSEPAEEPAEADEPVAEEPAEPETPAIDGAKVGYDGDDPVVYAVYEYLINEIGKDHFEPADYSIPTVDVIETDDSDPNLIKVKGCYEVDNYNLEADTETLKCVSGGSFPGCMVVAPNGDGTYKVTEFQPVEDGGNFEPTAKEIFGDSYDKFMEHESDEQLHKDLRLKSVSLFVKANEIQATKYQDEGWDPVDLQL